MAITTSTIFEQQKLKLLSMREAHFLDFKSKDIQPAKLTRTISAFANAEGGDLYIGIFESRDRSTRFWDGFLNEEAANGHIQAIESLFPLGTIFIYEFLESRSSKGLVLYVSVRKSKDIIYASDGRPYVRLGAQNYPADLPSMLERLKLNKGVTSFEINTLDIALDFVINSPVMGNFINQVIPSSEPEAWLKKQILINRDKPTVACVLLFAEEPQAILPKRCGIKIYRYQTGDKSGSRETLAFEPINIEGPLISQIKEAVDTTVKVIENILVIGPNGMEIVKYPRETLHEIITNAVLHRDYSIQTDIHIRIFDNRIEVESPGLLAGHITIKNILNEQFARNGVLVRIINKFPDPPNMDIGEGLNTAFAAMKMLKLKYPDIEQKEQSILVNIKHEPLGSPFELILDYLRSNPTINNRTAREICSINSENKMKRIFEKMIASGLIKRVPELKGKLISYQRVETSLETSVDATQNITLYPRLATLWDIPDQIQKEDS